MENKRLTILVNSCDKNSDLWEVFFKVMQKHWQDCPYRIILNTETRSYSFDGFNIECLRVAEHKTEEELRSYAWSDRVKDNLKHVNTKYTLFLLEDFYFESPVQNDLVENLLDRLDTIKKLGALYLMEVSANYPSYYDKKTGLYKIHKYVNFKANATAAIWNTAFLQKVLRKGESPWDLEQKGTKRVLHSNRKFYAQSNKYKQEIKKIFELDFSKQVAQGKWTSSAKDFLTGLGLEIDFESRGVVEFVAHNGEGGEQARLERMKKWHAKNRFLYGLNFLVDRYICGFFRKLKRKK